MTPNSPATVDSRTSFFGDSKPSAGSTPGPDSTAGSKFGAVLDTARRQIANRARPTRSASEPGPHDKVNSPTNSRINTERDPVDETSSPDEPDHEAHTANTPAVNANPDDTTSDSSDGDQQPTNRPEHDPTRSTNLQISDGEGDSLVLADGEAVTTRPVTQSEPELVPATHSQGEPASLVVGSTTPANPSPIADSSETKPGPDLVVSKTPSSVDPELATTTPGPGPGPGPGPSQNTLEDPLVHVGAKVTNQVSIDAALDSGSASDQESASPEDSGVVAYTSRVGDPTSTAAPAGAASGTQTGLGGDQPASLTPSVQVGPSTPIAIADPANGEIQAPASIDASPIDAPADTDTNASQADQTNPVWRQVRRALGSLRRVGPGEELMTIKLKPAELGAVTVRINTSAAGIKVSLVADSPLAAQELNQQKHELLRDLGDSGFSQAGVDVSTGQQGHQDNESDSAPSNSSSGRPSSLDGSAETDSSNAGEHNNPVYLIQQRLRHQSNTTFDLTL